jgi:aryl-phospho-beta-D-glucosidase BglC (GH1 family)
MRRAKFGVALFLLCGLLSGVATAQADGAGSVAFRRAEKLKRGINASEWFAQVHDKRGYTTEHFQAWTTAEDIALIKAMGFDHVRLSVNPQPMFNAREPNKIPAEYLASLDAAVKMILDHGLAVVIDLHPESDFKARMEKEDDFVQEFADYWRTLAAHYSTCDAERVFLEIMNEPEFTDRYRWLGVQMKLAAAIREGAPVHTIIAAGARWSSDDELVFQEPLHDPNVIYNFHFYEPHIFTHQGATWGAYSWHWLRGLKYPSSPEQAARVAAQVPEERDRLQVIRYGLEHWDAARIEAEMKQAAEWARRRGVPLVCNEFGVYRAYADPEDRAAWLRDVRTALEHNGIGWTMWDYAGSFGVVTKKDGKTVVDEGVLRALGVK